MRLLELNCSQNLEPPGFFLQPPGGTWRKNWRLQVFLQGALRDPPSKHTQGRGGEQGCSLPSSRVGSSREQILGVLNSPFWSTLGWRDSGFLRVPERGTVVRSVYTLIIYYRTKFEPQTRKTQWAPLEGSAPPEGSGGELGETIFMMGLVFL